MRIQICVISLLFICSIILPSFAFIYSYRVKSTDIAPLAIDWWPQFQHDLSRSGYSTSSAPDTANLIWQVSADDIFYGTFTGTVTYNGRVIATDNGGRVIALDETTGARIWMTVFAPTYIMGTPSTDGNLVYVVTCEDGNLRALSFADGHQVWSQNIGPGRSGTNVPNYISSPAISASTNKVVVGAVAAPGGSVGPATVWAFDKSSGALSWRFDRTVGDFFSSPAIDEAGGRVFIASAHSDIEPNNPSQLYCLNLANGQLLHTYTFANSGVRTTPTIAGGKVFFPYSPTGQNKIYCFDEDLNLLWSHSGTVSQRMGAIAVSNGYIYTGHDCLDATNGNLIWHIGYSEGGGVDFCSPVVADGKMYIENGIGFCCYNANNGAMIWNYTNALGVKYGTPSISNGKAFFTSNRQGGLWAFEKGALPYDVTIKAHCNTEGADVNVAITKDGSSTGFSTPHTFTGLTGSHTFAVPNTDVSGHPFKQWNTGQTTTAIAISSGGTYTAYYEATPAPYDVFIYADDYSASGNCIAVHVVVDENYATQYVTPFELGLVGTHSFRVVDTQDARGHLFWKWSTGETSAMIQVTGPGNYWAHYRALHDVALTDLKCSSDFVDLGKNIAVQISAENKGTSTETFLIDVTVNNRHNQYATLALKPDEKNSVPVCISTNGWPTGTYSIGAKAILDSELLVDWSNNEAPTHSIDVGSKPYFIIVAGRYLAHYSDSQSNRDYLGIINVCNQAYRTLTEKVHVDKSQICYLAPEPQVGTYPGRLSTSMDLVWAIQTWAYSRMNKYCSLFIYLNGHGLKDQFFIDYVEESGMHRDILTSDNLAVYLGVLKNAKNPRIHVIIDACRSGSFIDNLYLVADATICSVQSNQNTPTFNGESMFGSTFWVAIGEGKSVFDAYNLAGGNLLVEESVFDDIHAGKEFYGVEGWTKRVPGPNGEGIYLSNLYMGRCEWAFPWVSSAIPTEYYTWPPPESVQIWAVIQNNTALCNVTVSMLPPDLVLPPENGTLNLETFQMVDLSGDGNFTVQIPSVNFTNHAFGPSVFRFLLSARQEERMVGYTRVLSVVFTEDGQPTADDTPPALSITRPLNLDTVHGIVNINGTVHDDVCIQKAELYIDNSFSQNLNLPVSSSSYFQFTLHTSTLQNGYHNVTVNAFDTSNNYSNETIGIWVINDVHDVDTVFLNVSKTIIGESLMLHAETTIVNQGSYTENLNVTLYVNSTLIETKTIANLNADGSATLTFTWNTTGFAKGNYTIWAYAWPVQDETDTLDNTFNDVTVFVTVAGDVTGEGLCDMQDISILVDKFLAEPSDPRWDVNCDVNDDHIIDMADISIAVDNFLKDP